MKHKVLVVIDSHFREYLPALFLKKSLEKEGIECHLTSKFSLGVSYNQIKPDILIVPKLHKIPHLAEIKKNTKIILLTAESFTGVKEGIAVYTKLWDVEKADYCFTWGKFDKEAFEELKLFKPGTTITTGNPINEHWYYSKERPKGRKRIGIATSLRALTHSAAPRNPLEQIISLEDNGSSGFFDPPNHSESWIAFEACWLRIIYDLVREFKDYEISIRPHPLENRSYYETLKKYHPSITISDHPSISEWLEEIDYLLSFVSTSQLDAYVKEVKVISIRKLFPKSILDNIPGSLSSMFKDDFPEPASYEELRNLMENFNFSSEKLERFLMDVYSFPSEKPSLRIAKEIKRILKQEPPQKEGRQIPLKLMHKFFSYVSFGPEMLLIMKDFKCFFFHSENVAVSYCPHRWKRNKRFKETFRKIIS